MKIKSLILLFAIIAVTGTGAFARGDKLSSGQWILTYASGQWILTYASGRAVTNSTAYVEINNDQTGFTGNTGCNRMFGTLAVDERRIAFTNVGTTKMMCKLPAGSVSETVFLKALDKAAKYAQIGNTLHIYDRYGRTILRFKRLVKQAPEDPISSRLLLDDRKWVLESFKNRKTLVAITGAFINFDSRKGSAGGNSGCNVFGGEFAAKGSKIKITDLISTMRACIEDGKMDVEREFLKGLREADRYEIKGGRLFLYDRKQLLLTLRGEAKN